MNNEEYVFAPDDFVLAGNDHDAFIDDTYFKQSYWKDMLSRFTKNKGAVVGLFVIFLIILMAIIGPGLNEYTYDFQTISHQNLAPRIELLEPLGIFDGSETMSTSTGMVEINKYVSEDGSLTGLE